MTFLLEWDFSIVAEPCPLIPSLLWEKELYLCLTPWDLWIDSLKPIECKTEAAHWKSSSSHLPVCALLIYGFCLGWGSLAVSRCDDAHCGLWDKPLVAPGFRGNASGVLKESESISAWCCCTIPWSHWHSTCAAASGTQLTEQLVPCLWMNR